MFLTLIKNINNRINSLIHLIEESKYFINKNHIDYEYIIKHSALKGSIAIDGISLTINEIENNILNIMIVPHTYENTIVKYYKKNDLVNIEIDLVFRYLEKIKNG